MAPGPHTPERWGSEAEPACCRSRKRRASGSPRASRAELGFTFQVQNSLTSRSHLEQRKHGSGELQGLPVGRLCCSILPLKEKLCYVLIRSPKIEKGWETLPKREDISFITRFYIFWERFEHNQCSNEEEDETGGFSVSLTEN